jgi:hypothetical protein
MKQLGEVVVETNNKSEDWPAFFINDYRTLYDCGLEKLGKGDLQNYANTLTDL